MTDFHITLKKKLLTTGVFVLGALFIMPMFVQAQVYIDPTGPSIGGNSATVLDTSATAQQKLGSLLIGQQGGAPARFCLNGTGNLTGADDATGANPTGHCVTSWSNVANALGGPFVNLVQTAPSGSASALTSYTGPQLGYVRIKGSGSLTKYTFQTDANNAAGAASPSTALYASASLIEDYAGYFSGKVSIEPSENGGVQVSRGRLCLNSTYPSVCVVGSPDYATCQANVNSGYYCISDWSQIKTANITDQLTLQTLASPLTESGSVWLSQSFNAGAAVVGVPPSTSPGNLTKPYCGDGMCSTEINENQSASANYCLVDCESIPVLTSADVTAVQASGGVTLTVLPRALSSTTQPYILIVRSNTPSFTFEPTDGTNYQVGGNSNFAIVSAGYQQGGFPAFITDQGNGIVPGTQYTYRVFEGNAYPRFAKVAQGSLNYYQVSIVAGAVSGGGGSGGSDCGSACDPPIIRVNH